MSEHNEATEYEFTLWRDLPGWVEQGQLVLPPSGEHDCSLPPWQDSICVVKAGTVVLSCVDGDLALPQGSVFVLTGLRCPSLRNPNSVRATVSIARRKYLQAGQATALGHANIESEPTMQSNQNLAEEYRDLADRFTRLVEGVADDATWNQPAPPKGWTARDVVRHLVEWFPPFLEQGAGIKLPNGPSVDESPVHAWCGFNAAVQAVLDNPTNVDKTFSNPDTGDLALLRAIAQFFTPDVFMHSWDLARATGQDETLDPERCAMMLEGMRAFEDLLRSSGQYGPRVNVSEDADPQSQFLGFIGRDPSKPERSKFSA